MARVSHPLLFGMFASARPVACTAAVCRLPYLDDRLRIDIYIRGRKRKTQGGDETHAPFVTRSRTTLCQYILTNIFYIRPDQAGDKSGINDGAGRRRCRCQKTPKKCSSCHIRQTLRSLMVCLGLVSTAVVMAVSPWLTLCI